MSQDTTTQNNNFFKANTSTLIGQNVFLLIAAVAVIDERHELIYFVKLGLNIIWAIFGEDWTKCVACTFFRQSNMAENPI